MISKKDLKDAGLRPLNDDHTRWGGADILAIGQFYFDTGKIDFWKVELRADRSSCEWITCYDNEELIRALDLLGSNYRNLKRLENASKNESSLPNGRLGE